ncbi:MAG TPA: YegS/Rv2252/BmrU family lipid kinase [Terriglobales bacterium]|jgi:YegS/Rv2252/BmrU family lipid kinase
MRRAVLLYNPLSGRRKSHRVADVNDAIAVLRSADVKANAIPTQAPADIAEQVKQAVAEGYDTIFACGGDGTIHDVLQGLVGTEAALGVIPLGTGNTLAHDLRLPLSPAAAARVALKAEPRSVAAGRITYQGINGTPASRYFTVTVGIGVDAHLFYELNPAMKNRAGMGAYYFNAVRLWLTHPMEEFDVELTAGDMTKCCSVSQLLAVRIRNFGGILRELAPGASLERNDLRCVLFGTRNRLAYLRYVVNGMFARQSVIAGIEAVHAERIRCQSQDATSRVFVHADGELLGTLPAEISVIPNAFRLLMPA